MPRESQFTAPSDECPEPGLWEASDGQSTEREVSWLVQAFITALKPRSVIETGTAYGKTTYEMAYALHQNGFGELVSLEVDPALVEHSRAVIEKSRVKNLPVRILHQSSMEYVPDQPIDFVWFDSLTHLRVPEFRRFYPWMHHRTVVGFHDTGPQHPTRPWIQQLIDEGLLQAIFLPTPRGVCFGRVLK